jgi:hypothetical protein
MEPASYTLVIWANSSDSVSNGMEPGNKNSGANPKLDQSSNAQKNPDDWLSGDDPMTPAQPSYLRTPCEQAGDPDPVR